MGYVQNISLTNDDAKVCRISPFAIIGVASASCCVHNQSTAFIPVSSLIKA
jgi:hypothetical protein